MRENTSGKTILVTDDDKNDGALFCADLVHLPDGFSLESVNYVMKGVCSDCRRKHN